MSMRVVIKDQIEMATQDAGTKNGGRIEFDESDGISHLRFLTHNSGVTWQTQGGSGTAEQPYYIYFYFKTMADPVSPAFGIANYIQIFDATSSAPAGQDFQCRLLFVGGPPLLLAGSLTGSGLNMGQQLSWDTEYIFAFKVDDGATRMDVYLASDFSLVGSDTSTDDFETNVDRWRFGVIATNASGPSWTIGFRNIQIVDQDNGDSNGILEPIFPYNVFGVQDDFVESTNDFLRTAEGTSTATSSFSLTDTSSGADDWETGEWIGAVVTIPGDPGGDMTITGSTGTVLTGASGWSNPGSPSSETVAYTVIGTSNANNAKSIVENPTNEEIDYNATPSGTADKKDLFDIPSFATDGTADYVPVAMAVWVRNSNDNAFLGVSHWQMISDGSSERHSGFAIAGLTFDSWNDSVTVWEVAPDGGVWTETDYDNLKVGYEREGASVASERHISTMVMAVLEKPIPVVSTFIPRVIIC